MNVLCFDKTEYVCVGTAVYIGKYLSTVIHRRMSEERLSNSENKQTC